MSDSIRQQLDLMLESCERSMALMQDITMTKQWEKLAESEHGFGAAMKQLQDFVEANQNEVHQLTEYADKFQQLSMKQRRVMRLIRSHMLGVSEDMSRFDQLSKKLSHFSEEVASS